MSQKTQKIEMIELKLVDPDPLQPRKNFDASRLHELAESIKTHGIMNPIIVEEVGKGRYILVDGERRYRAASMIGLKEIPVVIREMQSPTQRLIDQFHLQEQHQDWSATEKALAVSELADALGYTALQMSKLLSISERTMRDYVAFSKIIEKQKFVKDEIPMNFAQRIVNLKNFARRTLEKYDEEFTKEDQAELERSIIGRIKGGDIVRPHDLLKIHASFDSDHKSVRKFMKNTDLTPDRLFLQTNAKASFYARRARNNFQGLITNLKTLKTLGVGKEVIRGIAPNWGRMMKDLQDVDPS